MNWKSSQHVNTCEMRRAWTYEAGQVLSSLYTDQPSLVCVCMRERGYDMVQVVLIQAATDSWPPLATEQNLYPFDWED